MEKDNIVENHKLLNAYFSGALDETQLRLLKVRVEADPALKLLFKMLQSLPEVTRRTHLLRQVENLRIIEADLEEE